MLRKLGVILSLFCVLSLQAQELSLSADKRSVRYGEPVNAELSIKISATQKSKGFAFTDSLQNYLGGLEIIGNISTDTVATENGADFDLQYLFKFQITGFDSGKFEMGPVVATLAGDSIASNSIFINVAPVALDTSATEKPIKEIEEIPLTFSDYVKAYWYYPSILAVLALAGYFLMRYLKKRKRKPAAISVEKPKPEAPPHFEALNRLETLLRNKGWENTEDKAFYSEISYIVRKYLGRRFDINALEYSSLELSSALKYKLQPKSLHDELAYILNLSDMVKFAKEKPGSTFAKESLEKAIDLVRRTTPIEEEINEQG